jgi:hypothetical protein
MKKLVVVLMVMLLMVGWAWAGEKEELNWEYQALVARFSLAQQRLPELRAIQDFAQKLDAKGYMIDKDGQVVEKPKPAPEKKEEPKK